MIAKVASKKAPKQGMLENVMRQFDNAADIIDLNKNIRPVTVYSITIL